MKVGDLVLLKHDPHKVLGVILKRKALNTKDTIYFVGWVDELCDSMWVDAWDLEVRYASR